MVFRFAGFEVDTLRLTLTRDGEAVPIEPKPLALVLHLLTRHPAIVPIEELFEALWPAEQVTAGSLTRAVRGARRALGRRELIRNYRRRGYAIGVDVERIAQSPDRTRNTRDPFVGRERELALLDRELDEASARRGRLVLLAGEPGIGKTRTAREVARRAAESGAEVVWGRAAEDGGAPALWPWLQVLRALARGLAVATLRATLGPSAGAVAAVVPEIRERLPRVTRPTRLVPEQERFRFFDAVAQWLVRLSADRPLVLIFDDLHAADPTTLELFAFAAAEIPDSRVLLLGTYRSVGRSAYPALDDALAKLSRLPEASPPIQLTGLSLDEVERLVDLVRDARFGEAAAIHARSDGNPFFVRELLRLERPADGGTTAGVRAVVRSRIESLDDESRTLLETASVIGREIPFDLLTTALDAEPDAVSEGLEAAQRAAFLEERTGAQGPVIQFAHAVLQETVYAAIPRRRRRELHRRVAEAIEALHAGAIEPHAASLANHHERAGNGSQTAAYSRMAGDQARDRFAYERAADAYTKALSHQGGSAHADERCDLLLALAEMRRLTGHSAEAIDALREAAAVARGQDDARRLARTACAMADCGEPIFPNPEALGLVEEATERLEGEEPALRVGLLGRRARLLLSYLTSREDALALALGDRAVEEARNLDDAVTRADALANRLVIHQTRPLERSARERLEMAQEALAAALLAGRDDLGLQARRHLIAIALEQGDAALLDAEIQHFASDTDRVRIRSQRHFAAAFLAMRALQQGRYGDAELWIDGAERLGDPADPLETLHTPATQRLLLPPQPERDRALEDAIRQMIQQSPMMPHCWLELALFCVERGRCEESGEILDRIAAPGLMDGLPRTVGWTVAATSLARLYCALGRRAEAAPLRGLLAPHGACRVVVGFGIACLGPVAYYRGRVAALLGRHDEALSQLRAGLAQDQRLAARPWEARDRLALAHVLEARGEADAASRERAAARAIAESIGVGDLFEREEDLLPL